MKDIRFTLAARCEAAGRDNNEDNYQVISDIASDTYTFAAGEELTLGDKGTLLVVCDGMGGMNAGEVASAIAVKTVKEAFAAEHISKEALANPEKFIVQAIQAADAAIKAEGKRNPETEGMGSTIVLAWLLRGKAYIGWCGDSRAYRYNPASRLERLSHDHSYVQELVDAGSITEELAFFHPNNNIITRSLGDPRGTAKPDTKVFDIQQGDLYLLCSDGLCGCLQDAQILSVIKQHHSSVAECRDALWQADEAAGWHDNVTTVLAQITKGGIAPHKPTSTEDTVAHLRRSNRRLKTLSISLASLLGVPVLAAALYTVRPYLRLHKPTQPHTADSTKTGNEYETAAEEVTPENKEEHKSAPKEADTNKKGKDKAPAPSNDSRTAVERASKEEPLPDVKTVQAPADLNAATGQEQGKEKQAEKIEVPEVKTATSKTTKTTQSTETTSEAQTTDTTKTTQD